MVTGCLCSTWLGEEAESQNQRINEAGKKLQDHQVQTWLSATLLVLKQDQSPSSDFLAREGIHGLGLLLLSTNKSSGPQALFYFFRLQEKWCPHPPQTEPQMIPGCIRAAAVLPRGQHMPAEHGEHPGAGLAHIMACPSKGPLLMETLPREKSLRPASAGDHFS